MTRRPLVAANWKMHGLKAQVKELAEVLVASLGRIHGIDILICPAFVHLPEMHAAFSGTKLLLGAQNLHQETSGAFTGEVSGTMLHECGCTYVLVGHSERRELFAESDEIVARKFSTAQSVGLIPLLCVGETREEREAGSTAKVVLRQLRSVIDSCGIAAMRRAVIAYEPVWAIGTGLTATPEQAQEVHALIRDEIRQKDRKCAESIRILYGGSVKADNAEELFRQADIDGGLVGGASLIAEEFKVICQVAIAQTNTELEQ